MEKSQVIRRRRKARVLPVGVLLALAISLLPAVSMAPARPSAAGPGSTASTARKMTPDKLLELGEIMNWLGTECAWIIGGDPNGMYIYAEVDGGLVSAGLFKDEGPAVRYFDPTREIAALLRDAWEAEPDEALRWVAIEYEIRDNQFDVQFRYPEELDPNEDSIVRRRAVLKKRFGNKPVIYMPMEQVD